MSVATKIRRAGFTIVELLIVIVVIAILAAITVVAYNGIQSRAYDSTVQSELKTFVTRAGVFNADKGYYPRTSDLDNLGYKVSKGAYAVGPQAAQNVTYCYNDAATPTAYAMLAMSKSGKAYYVTNSRSVTDYGWSWTTVGANCANVNASFTVIYNGYVASDSATGPWRTWVGGN